jgi:inhibitor of KinA
MAEPAFPRIVPLGDRALVIEFGDAIDPALSARIAALAQRLRADPPAGVHDVVPTYATLALHYDPVAFGSGESPYDVLAAQVEAWLDGQTTDAVVAGRRIEIPVCYGGEYGADLAELAARHEISTAQLIEMHSAPEYQVHMLGFVPGFAYLGGLDARLATPRRESPRARVPAGSVAIGGGQTGIFPLETPGGWHLIGRTPLRLFVADAEPPCLLSAGDRVRFVAIDAGEFASFARDAA